MYHDGSWITRLLSIVHNGFRRILLQVIRSLEKLKDIKKKYNLLCISNPICYLLKLRGSHREFAIFKEPISWFVHQPGPVVQNSD